MTIIGSAITIYNTILGLISAGLMQKFPEFLSFLISNLASFKKGPWATELQENLRDNGYEGVFSYIKP